MVTLEIDAPLETNVIIEKVQNLETIGITERSQAVEMIVIPAKILDRETIVPEMIERKIASRLGTNDIKNLPEIVRTRMMSIVTMIAMIEGVLVVVDDPVMAIDGVPPTLATKIMNATNASKIETKNDEPGKQDDGPRSPRVTASKPTRKYNSGETTTTTPPKTCLISETMLN